MQGEAVSLTKAQRQIMQCLPDSLATGLPANTVAMLCGDHPTYWASDKLFALLKRGLVQREKPNEEWPLVYATTEKGRAALTQEPCDG